MHPLTGGVILFSRTFSDVAQLKALPSSIRELRTPALLISVDHEGGRVQRFGESLLSVPVSMSAFGSMRQAWAAAEQYGIEDGSTEASGGLSPLPLQYLNRLSDLFFILARRANLLAGVTDVLSVSYPPLTLPTICRG